MTGRGARGAGRHARTRRSAGVLRPALRRRWVEAALTLGLTALVCATALLVPVLEREIVQSVLNVRRSEAPVTDLGLRHVVRATQGPEREPTGPDDQPDPELPTTEDVDAQLPAAARTILQPAVSEVVGTFVGSPERVASPVGRLRARSDACAHVRILAGRCPSAAGEVLLSARDAGARRWTVGQRLRVQDRDGSGVPVALSVTGTYEPVDGPYWFGDLGNSKLSFSGEQADDPSRVLDDLLTPEETLTSYRRSAPDFPPGAWPGIARELDYPPATREIPTDAFIHAATELEAFVADASQVTERVQVQRATSAGVYARTLEREREQTRTTVPLLLGQFALVVASVLWLVLVALTNARRPEMAISRLRGRSIGRVRQLLLAESSAPILLGTVAGAALAGVGALVASRALLPGVPRLDLRAGDLLWLGAAVVLCLGLAVAAVLRPSRRPVVELLRDVPVRVRGFGLGPLPAVVVALGLVLLVGALTGSVTGAAVGLTPALLAAAAGVLVSRAAPAVLTAAGRAALRRGRAVTATARLESARRPTGRWLVPVTSVASASLVFGLTSWGLASSNYEQLAEARVGAPVALQVDSPDILRLSTTVAKLDPSHRRATPLVVVPRVSASTVAVDPDGFSHIAALAPGDADRDLSGIAVSVADAIEVTGRFLTGRVQANAVTPAGATGALGVSLDVESADGSRREVELGDVPLDGRATAFSAYTPCFQGCTVRAVRVTTSEPRDGLGARISLSGLKIDDAPSSLGATGQWTPFEQEPAHLRVRSGADALTLDAATAGRREIVAPTVSQPTTVPALTTPGLRATGAGDAVTTADASGTGDLEVVPQGTLERLPIVGGQAVVVSLNGLLTTGRVLDANGRSFVLLADDSAASVAAARRALSDAGIPVLAERRPGQAVHELGTSAAAWSLRLAIVTAALSLLTAILGLLVLAENSRRSRTWDLAALRLMGVRAGDVRRMAVGELVPLSVLGVLTGIGCGVLGGIVAIRTLPMYAEPPEYDVTSTSPSVLSIALAALLVLLPVVLAAGSAALRAARTSTFGRLREAG